MAIVRRDRPLPRAAARPTTSSTAPARAPAAAPARERPIIARPTGDISRPVPALPDAIAADQRFARLTAAELLAELQLQRERVAKGFYAMGLLLRELARPERYKIELGFETFDDLLEQKYLTNRMTAMKYIAVATIFDELVATEVGIEKSYALVRYASAKGSAEDAPKLLQANVMIAGERVRDMSYRDLLRAARELKAPAPPPAPSDEEQAARRTARTLQAGLRRTGSRSAVARARRNDGSWIVTVELSVDDAAKRASTM